MRGTHVLALLAIALTSAAPVAWSQVTVNDDFTQASDTNDWATFNGACLTAGNGKGSIPECTGLAYYKSQVQVGGQTGTLPDKPGFGALRFTNGYTSGKSGFMYGFNQAGGIISNFTFDAGAGVSVVFKTVTYRGNSGGNGGSGTVNGNDGADGMSFFLIDGSYPPYDLGAFGGSLGYSCSNTNNDPTVRSDGSVRGYDGLPGAYLGLGIDEFGNFLNPGDNTASGPGLQAGRIGLRGAGSINWKSLSTNAATAQYYPTSLSAANQALAVQATCKSGKIWDYSKSTPTQTSTAIADYAAIPSGVTVLPNSGSNKMQIANEAALTRDQTQPIATRAIPIAYRLKITQDGLLSFAYSYNGGPYIGVINGQSITQNNGKLPQTLRFGFAGSTGGSNNVHEILCFQAAPATSASTSVSVNAKQAARIQTGTQAFLAAYFPADWTGRLTASDLMYDPTTKVPFPNPTANWDASCNLTGSANCLTIGGKVVTVQGPNSRTMLTWNDSTKAGVAFRWANLSTTQQNNLDPGATNAAPNRLNYLRGNRTKEINSAGVGLYRARDNVLADIINSSPTWVGPPSAGYSLTWKDNLYASTSMPENGSNSYAGFVSTYQTRLNVVYAGANDGLLHGFKAGGYDATGNFVSTGTTPNNGAEVMAYIPGAVVNSIHNASDPTVDYSNSQYAHAYFVDATPATGDLYYANAWHTWVTGGLGAGGSALYALDVTNPQTFSESSPVASASNAGVVGEWTPASISCTNVSNCGNSMGNTYGTPAIARLHSGDWAVIFGNGYGSSTGDAGIYIMTVDHLTGANTFYYLSTGSAAAGKTGNGIATPTAVDLDFDHVTDYVYAGDLLGNVWRFDLTSSLPAGWSATPVKIFSDPNGHPITTKVVVGAAPNTPGNPRVVLDFGTGQRTPMTTTSSSTYDQGTHNLYGVWDSNMTTWNATSTPNKYASMPSPPLVSSVSQLQQQTLTLPGADGSIHGSSNPICWADLTTCTTGGQYGFYINLPGSNEQVIYNPVIYQNALMVNTTVPAGIQATTSCATPTDTGNTIIVAFATGAPIPAAFPNYSNDTAGGQTNATGTPILVYVGSQLEVLTQTTGQAGKSGPFDCTQGGKTSCGGGLNLGAGGGKRLTWIQRR